MPFTADQFFDVFDTYNRATWPASILLWVLAVSAALSAIFKRPRSYRFALIVLAILWAWSGAVYHLIFFTAIDPAAWVFGIGFLLEAMLLLWLAFHRHDVRRPTSFNLIEIAGVALIVYALLAYPLLNSLFGHADPRAPAFGAPCPVTIFTLAILLPMRVPLYSASIPVVWALIGSSAAVLFGIYADLGLIVAAIVYSLFRFWKFR